MAGVMAVDGPRGADSFDSNSRGALKGGNRRGEMVVGGASLRLEERIEGGEGVGGAVVTTSGRGCKGAGRRREVGVEADNRAPGVGRW
jgi:hypothetical protein